MSMRTADGGRPCVRTSEGPCPKNRGQAPLKASWCAPQRRTPLLNGENSFGMILAGVLPERYLSSGMSFQKNPGLLNLPI